jgi:hypothetical protein
MNRGSCVCRELRVRGGVGLLGCMVRLDDVNARGVASSCPSAGESVRRLRRRGGDWRSASDSDAETGAPSDEESPSVDSWSTTPQESVRDCFMRALLRELIVIIVLNVGF